jgi:hypothetical protein
MRTALCLCAILLLPLAGVRAQEKPAKPDKAALEKQFAEKMSGAKMVGYWSLWGKEDKPASDSYTLGKVSKVEGDKEDKWTFEARIQFGGVDVTVPVPVEVKWAGSTPVITVDKVAVPGVGTYSARVVIHDNHYAATWDGGDHGGYMWGKIVKDAKGESKAKEGAKK